MQTGHTSFQELALALYVGLLPQDTELQVAKHIEDLEDIDPAELIQLPVIQENSRLS